MNRILNYIKKYSFALGIILFFMILRRINLKDLYGTFSKLNIYYLIIFLPILFVLLYYIKGYRWNYLKKKQKIFYSINDSVLMYGASMLLAIATPSRLGELAKVVYLIKEKHSVARSLATVIADRICDLIFLIIFGCIGIIYFSKFFREQLILKSIIIAVSLIMALSLLILLLTLKTNFIKKTIKKILYATVPQKYQKAWKIELNTKGFFNSLKNYNAKDLLFVFILTTFYWSTYYLIVYVLAKSVAIDTVPLLYLALAVTAVSLINLLPFSIAGIGTRETTLLILLSGFGITKEQIITLSLLMFMFYPVIALVGVFCWMKKPIPFFK